MKKYIAALLSALLLYLSACAPQQEAAPPEGAYPIYFAVTGVAATAKALDFEYQIPDTRLELVPGLVRCLLKGPQASPSLASPFPSGVQLLSYRLEEGRLLLDLSEQYGGLSGMNLTLANACLTLTLSTVPDVEQVVITVEGVPLPYQAIHELHAEDFVLSGAEEEAVSLTVALYFPRVSGGGLGVETREIIKTEDDTLIAAVIAALSAGPQYQSMRGLMPPGAALRSASVENGVCYLDLSEDFYTGIPKNNADARLLLYSVVDTLCALEPLGVQAVQFFIDGRQISSYGGIPAAAPLEPDFGLAQDG